MADKFKDITVAEWKKLNDEEKKEWKEVIKTTFLGMNKKSMENVTEEGKARKMDKAIREKNLKLMSGIFKQSKITSKAVKVVSSNWGKLLALALFLMPKKFWLGLKEAIYRIYDFIKSGEWRNHIGKIILGLALLAGILSPTGALLVALGAFKIVMTSIAAMKWFKDILKKTPVVVPPKTPGAGTPGAGTGTGTGTGTGAGKGAGPTPLNKPPSMGADKLELNKNAPLPKEVEKPKSFVNKVKQATSGVIKKLVPTAIKVGKFGVSKSPWIAALIAANGIRETVGKGGTGADATARIVGDFTGVDETWVKTQIKEHSNIYDNWWSGFKKVVSKDSKEVFNSALKKIEPVSRSIMKKVETLERQKLITGHERAFVDTKKARQLPPAPGAQGAFEPDKPDKSKTTKKKTPDIRLIKKAPVVQKRNYPQIPDDGGTTNMKGVKWNSMHRNGRKGVEGMIWDIYNRHGKKPKFTSGLRGVDHELYNEGSKHSNGTAFDLSVKELGNKRPLISADLSRVFNNRKNWFMQEELKGQINSNGSEATADHFHVHMAAKGFHGEVNKPTGFIAGEAGRERVDITPLHTPEKRLASFNNLQSQNLDAQRMGGGGGGGTTIVAPQTTKVSQSSTTAVMSAPTAKDSFWNNQI
jgi:hypothetical protein